MRVRGFRRVTLLLGGLAVAANTSGCARHASAAECASLLDRYVELLVREQDPKTPDAEVARQKALTRDKAAKDSSFASCPDEVTAKGVMCAMAAGNVDEFEKCLE